MHASVEDVEKRDWKYVAAVSFGPLFESYEFIKGFALE
jgi:hypothetical protein